MSCLRLLVERHRRIHIDCHSVLWNKKLNIFWENQPQVPCINWYSCTIQVKGAILCNVEELGNLSCGQERQEVYYATMHNGLGEPNFYARENGVKGGLATAHSAKAPCADILKACLSPCHPLKLLRRRG